MPQSLDILQPVQLKHLIAQLRIVAEQPEEIKIETIVQKAAEVDEFFEIAEKWSPRESGERPYAERAGKGRSHIAVVVQALKKGDTDGALEAAIAAESI